MSSAEIDNIIIKLCALRRLNEVEHMQLSNTDIKLIHERAIVNGVAAWIIQNIDNFYFNNESLISLRNLLKQQALITMIDCQRKLTTYFEIANILSEEGIEVVAIKGIAMMAAFYPEIAERPIGDIDILINHKDAYRAHQLLVDKYPNSLIENKRRTTIITETIATHLPALRINGVEVEIHFNLYSADSNALPNADVCQHVDKHQVAQRDFYTIDLSLMLYHLSTHVLKSRRSKGIRMSWIVDIMLILSMISVDNVISLKETFGYNKKRNKDILSLLSLVLSMIPKNQSEYISNVLLIKEIPLTSEYLQCTNKGLKPGLTWRIKTISVLLREMFSQLNKTKGVSAKWHHLKDMIYDLKNKKK